MTFTFGLGGGTPPSPLKFSGLPGAGGAPNVGGTNGAPSAMNQQAVMNAAMQNPDLAGVLQGIAGIGGDVWGVISKILPHDGAGNVDWGKLGGDITGFLSAHKGDILAAASVYQAAQRQGKSDQYAQQAVDTAKGAYDAKAPLRMAGQAGMLDPGKGAPDLSALKTQAAGTGQLRAPLPMSGGTNLPSIQNVAGAGSGNPFAKALPMAQAPQMPKPQTAGPLPLSPSPGFPTNTPPTSPPVDAQRPMVPPDKKTIQPLPIGTPGTGLTGPGAVPGVPPVIAPPGTAPGLMRPPGMKPPQGWALPLSAS